MGCVPFAATTQIADDEEDDPEAEEDGSEPKRETSMPAGFTQIAEEMPVGASEYIGFKWGIFLRAPDIFFKLLRLGSTVWTPFGKLATVKFGLKSGCDKFFFVRDVTDEQLAKMGSDKFKLAYGLTPEQTKKVRVVLAGDKSAHKIEAKYLEPVVFNLMEINAAEINPALLKKKVLLISDERASLRKTEVLKYIEWGEREDFHRGPSCSTRSRWYDVTVERRGQLVWSMAHRYRHIAAFNSSHFVCNHNVFTIFTNQDMGEELLAAVLNSTMVALNKHQFGRTMGGDPLLKTEVVDTKMMLVPDPRKASPELQKRIGNAFASLRKRPIGKLVDVDSTQMGPTGDLAEPDRQALDDAVLELLGVSSPTERLALRNELYREITVLYRSIRTAEKRMQEFRGQSARAGTLTPRAIAEEIWGSLDPKPASQTLQGRVASEPAETIDLPKAKALISNSLFNPNSLEIAGKYIALGSMERARFAKALSDMGISGKVPIPISPQVCADALALHQSEMDTAQALFAEKAAEYSGDDKRQQTIIKELWRLFYADN